MSASIAPRRSMKYRTRSSVREAQMGGGSGGRGPQHHVAPNRGLSSWRRLHLIERRQIGEIRLQHNSLMVLHGFRLGRAEDFLGASDLIRGAVGNRNELGGRVDVQPTTLQCNLRLVGGVFVSNCDTNLYSSLTDVSCDEHQMPGQVTDGANPKTASTPESDTQPRSRLRAQ